MTVRAGSSSGRMGILDALRGLAGLVVVVFHLGEASVVFEPAGHGYLAVEFFLLMTGFVLGKAYDGRWAQGMGLGAFFRRRLVRLHPLAVLGTLIGFVVFLLSGEAGRFGMAGVPLGQAALWAVVAACLIPIAGHGAMSPFNACTWTLYYEYLANVLYATVLRRCGKALLVVLTLLAALWSLATALNVGPYPDGSLGVGLCSLAGGWGFTPKHVYFGLVRMAFPLLLGLLLSRLGWRLSLDRRVAFPVALALFAGVLFCPESYAFGIGWGMPWLNGVFEFLSVGLVLPVALLIGAGSEMPGALSNRVGQFFGELSYPLYMTHYPFHVLQGAWVAACGTCLPLWVFYAEGALQLVLSVLFAWLVMRFYDEPVRRWLTPVRKERTP